MIIPSRHENYFVRRRKGKANRNHNAEKVNESYIKQDDDNQKYKSFSTILDVSFNVISYMQYIYGIV